VACTQGKDRQDFQQNSNKKEWHLIQNVAFSELQHYKVVFQNFFYNHNV